MAGQEVAGQASPAAGQAAAGHSEGGGGGGGGAVGSLFGASGPVSAAPIPAQARLLRGYCTRCGAEVYFGEARRCTRSGKSGRQWCSL